MDNINFSIIIPHYNVPKLLARCLYTIPQRDDLEVIVVDDNSSPDIVDFDNFPGKNRPNTRIILDKKGGGGGYARNKGLEVARGKWVLFSDSDDYFTYCLNDMLDKYVNSEADVVYFNAIGSNAEYYTPSPRANHLNNAIMLSMTNREKGEAYLRFLFGEPWCKLAKREMIEKYKIRFDETPIHNDTAYSYLVGYYARTVDIERHAIYVITFREGSVSVSLSDEKRLIRIEVFARAEKFRKDHGVDIEKYGYTEGLAEWHYYEVYSMYRAGEKSLAMKGIEIIHKYNPSLKNIKWRIWKRVPRQIFNKVKHNVGNLFRAIHLMSPKPNYDQ